MFQHIFECQMWVYTAQMNGGERNFTNLLTKIDDVLDRSFRDVGVAEIANFKFEDQFKSSVGLLKKEKVSLKESIRVQDAEKGGKQIQKVYELMDYITNTLDDFEEQHEDFFNTKGLSDELVPDSDK